MKSNKCYYQTNGWFYCEEGWRLYVAWSTGIFNTEEERAKAEKEYLDHLKSCMVAPKDIYEQFNP